MLKGITAKVLNPKQLLDEKEVYEQTGRTPRLKDIESKQLLKRILNEGLDAAVISLLLEQNKHVVRIIIFVIIHQLSVSIIVT